MNSEPDNWRIANIERRLDVIERYDPAVLAERISQLEKQVDRRFTSLEQKVDERLRQMDDEQAATRRAIVAAALTITVSALLTAATIWLVLGQ